MALRIGTYGRCPVTGRTGWLTKFIGDVALYRAADGTLFKRQSAAQGRKCRVRIKGLGPDSPWLAGVIVGSKRAKIVEHCPIWHGAVVGRDTAEIRVV